MSEQAEQFSPYQIAARDAAQKFRLTGSDWSMESVYAAAEAGTGSRYAVVITRLPESAHGKEGGTHLISLLQPWQANMVFTVDGYEIHEDYLLEKLTPRDRVARGLHGGDAQAVVLLVAKAVQLAVSSGVAE